MKYELGINKPEGMKAEWPDMYEHFSWMEYVATIPQPLFVVTTRKENGEANACFHAWSTFTGDGGGYYCMLSILKGTHTYKNIMRDKEWCINIPTKEYKDQCYNTIENNHEGTNEITCAGFTEEESKVVNAPRIKECFMNFECELEWERDLHPGSKWAILTGKIMHMGLDGEYANGNTKKKLDKFGVMYNIHSPTNPVSGEIEPSEIGELTLMK